jgi:hypothetical protein
MAPVSGTALGMKSRATHWMCRCDCGASQIVRQDRLLNGKSQSCGCLRAELSAERETKHGHSKGHSPPSPTYQIWLQVVAWCHNPKNRYYANYGGRGITVCDRWRQFEHFLADMGERPPGLTLRRFDNDGPYCPENCHWAPRLTSDGQIWGFKTIMCDGVELPLAAAARRKGISIGLLRYRLAHGWDPQKALQPAGADAKPKKISKKQALMIANGKKPKR